MHLSHTEKEKPICWSHFPFTQGEPSQGVEGGISGSMGHAPIKPGLEINSIQNTRGQPGAQPRVPGRRSTGPSLPCPRRLIYEWRVLALGDAPPQTKVPGDRSDSSGCILFMPGSKFCQVKTYGALTVSADRMSALDPPGTCPYTHRVPRRHGPRTLNIGLFFGGRRVDPARRVQSSRRPTSSGV